MNTTEISFASLLGLLFIGLKLTSNITWSWWWVLSPFWISLAVYIIIFIILIGFAIAKNLNNSKIINNAIY